MTETALQCAGLVFISDLHHKNKKNKDGASALRLYFFLSGLQFPFSHTAALLRKFYQKNKKKIKSAFSLLKCTYISLLKYRLITTNIIEISDFDIKKSMYFILYFSLTKIVIE